MQSTPGYTLTDRGLAMSSTPNFTRARTSRQFMAFFIPLPPAKTPFAHDDLGLLATLMAGAANLVRARA
jgi:hypothetical protein